MAKYSSSVKSRSTERTAEEEDGGATNKEKMKETFV
jgi:hypothetical protein